MESDKYLSDVFDLNKKENQKYQIVNFDNIPKLINLFQKNEETKKYPLNLENISNVFDFLKSSFMNFRINIPYFNEYSKSQLYQILIDFYLNNDYSSKELDELCLNLIDTLINNIDISKSIIDSVIQKFAKFYYSLEEPNPKYENLSKLLIILNHLYGINLNIKKPKHYYYFCGLDKYEKNYINVPLEEPNQTMAVTLWFKTYNNKKGELFSLNTSSHKNVFKITIEENKLCLIQGEKKNYIIKTDFYSSDYNNISLYYKPSKKKVNISLYVNEKQILKDHTVNDIEEDSIVTLLLIGKNYFGEITSILVTKNNINFDEYKKLSLSFPFGLVIEKDVINFSNDFSKIATMLRSIHVPYGGKYNLYNNQKKDIIFGKYNGVNYYRSFQKKINLLGGINIILPIIELLYLNMKLCIEHKDLLYLFFELILTIIKYKKKNMENAINHKFFMVLSIFIEKMPEELFNNKIHQIIIDLAKNIFFYHNTCSLYLDYCDYVLLNEKIVFKFIASEQVKFWEQIYKYYDLSEKFSLPINKLISILTCNDSKYSSGQEICCKTHYECYLEEYKPTNAKIMDPDFNTKTEYLFLLFKSIILSDKNKEYNYKEMTNMLAFNNSPCLILKILEFIMEEFSKKGQNKEQEKEYKKLKDTIFSIFNSEEYKIILFNLLFSEFLDIKYTTINFIFMLYEYDKKKFNFSFKFIKENIFPKKTTVNLRYINFAPLKEDICSLAEHCTNKILKMNSIHCYEHDNIICSSIFNFSYLSLYYTKFINLFTEFLNKNIEKYEEIIDLLLYLSKNLNIEVTISLFTQLSLLAASNENLVKKVFTFIPLLNYILETITYYSSYINSVSQSTFKFLVNIITSIKENKTKLFIIEYIIKYYSLMKNKDSIQNNSELNSLINKILTKLLKQIANEYLNTENYENNNEFIIDLTSILFDYIAIFNQDKKLYKVYTTNTKTNYIFSSYNGVSIICSFIQGLNIREIEAGLKNPKLEMQWWDYEIVSKILNLFQKEYNISEIYLKDKDIKTQLDKVLYIYDNLIYKDDINDKTLFKKKQLLYYVSDPNKNNPLIKIISYLYMLCLNMCKDENEYKKLLSQFIEYIEFIIVISTKIYSSTNEEKNKKELNHDTITFALMFLFDAITQPNDFLCKNKNIKDLIILSFNELLSICLYVYIERVPEIKTGLIKGVFKKMKSKIQKQSPLKMTPPYEIIYDFLIKQENNNEEEENNKLLLKNNEKNFIQFYIILTGSDKMQNNFNANCQKYMSKRFAHYINFDLIINLSKTRLIEDTTNNDFEQKEEKYNIDFDKIKTDIIPIITKVKMSSSDYINYSYQTQRSKRNEYKSLKKELFIWNGPWSNKELFYKNKNRIKYKLYNHLTKSLLRPFLVPILDLEYYTPIFTHFKVEKIFNKNENAIPLYKDLCLNIDKIINSYENKTEDYQYIDNSDEEELNQAKKYECCFVKPTHHIKGILLCSNKGILFKVFLNQKTLTNDINDTDTSRQEQDIDYDNIRHTCYGSYFVEHPKNKDNLYFNFPFERIKLMFKRIYYYHQTGLEIYTINNKSYYFNFKNASVRNEIYDAILPHLQKHKITIDNMITNWKKYKISNMELLMWLNVFGGRSYNDLSQYPVIPWILCDYSRKELKEEELLQDKTLYRDLSLPLGMIANNDKGERRDGYIYNLKSTQKIKSEKSKNQNNDTDLFEKPYNYGTHYSNPFYVAHFLTRIYPFSYIMIELQGNKFDDPDRLFISMNNSYLGATTQKGDVRELIPEIYSIPEIYHNINDFDLGIRRNKIKVIDVECPEWSGNDPYKLITYLNLAFESDEISSNIGGWIDLVFGFKQRGKEAEKYNNIYMFNSYPDLVDIENMSIDKKRYYYRFVEFGSCPKQLFKKPFENKESYSGFKHILDKNVSVITIELKNKNKPKEKDDNIIQEETEDDIINQIKQKTNVKQFFPLPKKGAKLLYANYTGIHLSQKKINEDTYRYDQNLMLYGFGIKFEKYFIGNNRIMDEPPSVMYGKGRFLLEGGYLDGLMMLSDFDSNSTEKYYNPNDNSPVTSIVMNKDENLAIIANNIGIIYIYEVKDKKWEFKKKIQYHSKTINYLFISDELNAFASCGEDNYVNIYSLPSCTLLHSIEVEEPELVFLSGRPLPIFIVYSKKLKKLLIYGVNGHFIQSIEIQNKPQYPFIYTSLHFRDYLIYSNKGQIIIRSLPYLEIFKTINLNGNNNLPINNLYLQFYQNQNETEKLYVLDQSIQTLYIIGDSSVN